MTGATGLALLLAPFRWWAPMIATAGKGLLQVGLFSWAATVFFQERAWVSVVKSILATAVYVILVACSVVILNLSGIIAVLRGDG